jgi:hypothetical protein
MNIKKTAMIMAILLSIGIGTPSLFAEGIVLLSPSVESADEDASIPSSAELGGGLATALKEKDLRGAFSFAKDDSFGGRPLSSIDVFGYSERTGATYALYGRARFTADFVEMEISLFDKESGGKRKSFYAKGERADLDDVIGEIAGKTVAFLYGIMGVAEDASKVTTRLFVPIRIEGWIPSTWGDALVGTARLESGFLFETALPSLSTLDFATYFRIGASFSYGVGMNTPGHPAAFEHDFRIGLPLEYYFSFEGGNRIGLTIEPLMDIGLYAVAIPYDDPLLLVSTAPGVSASLWYDFAFSKDGSSIGAFATATVLATEPFYLELQFGLRILLAAGEY